MKYSSELIAKLVDLYHSGKTIPELSKLYNIPVKLLRNRTYGKIVKRAGIESSNNHEVFMSRIFYNESGCWEWKGNLNNKGYGQYGIKGKILLTHRYSYSYFKGNCEGAFVCHTCDNPKCVNPDHLYLGDYYTNAQDKVKRMRMPMVKLTKDDVLNIRELYKSGLTYTSISTKFNISRYTISSIIKGKTWNWLK